MARRTVRDLAHSAHLTLRYSVKHHETSVGIEPYESRAGLLALAGLVSSPWKLFGRVLSGRPHEFVTAFVQS